MAKILWVGRQQILGQDLSFTFYKINEEKLFIKTGMIGTHEEEVYLYKIKDKKFTQTITQRIFGVGSIVITVTDGEASTLILKDIKEPIKVKQILDTAVDQAKSRYGLHGTEMFGASLKGREA